MSTDLIPPPQTSFGAPLTAPGFFNTGQNGATASSRYVGATNAGAPIAGTFAVGDFVIGRDGTVFICTVAGTPGTWISVGSGTGIFAGEVQGTDFKATGLAGAVNATRYAGGVIGGPPVAGNFLIGDYVVDRNGTIYVCTAAGNPGTWSDLRNPTFVGALSGTTVTAAGITGATAVSRYAGATAAGAPSTGTFAVGDFVIGRDGAVYVCTVAGSPGTWVNTRSPLYPGQEVTAADFAPGGLTGATAASRYCGATNTGAPVAGTFAVGDFIVARDGTIWICIAAGTPGTWANILSGASTFTTVTVNGITGATAGARLAGATASGAPASGTFAVGDVVVDRTGAIWVCTVAGTPGTWVQAGQAGGPYAPIASPTFTGVVTSPVFSDSGLTGATSGGRFVGATASGAPASGTFAVGDYVVDRTGLIWVCTVAGSPGTWKRVGAATLVAEVTRAAAQTLTTATVTALSWDTVVTDPYTFYNAGNPTRLTVPAGWAGDYLYITQGAILANATGRRQANPRKNGATSSPWAAQIPGNATADAYLPLTATYLALAVGDYVETTVYQDSGGNLNTATPATNPNRAALMFIR